MNEFTEQIDQMAFPLTVIETDDIFYRLSQEFHGRYRILASVSQSTIHRMLLEPNWLPCEYHLSYKLLDENNPDNFGEYLLKRIRVDIIITFGFLKYTEISHFARDGQLFIYIYLS